MIYLDHAATTPLRPEARAVLEEFAQADGPFANPASTHSLGRQMGARVAQAREDFAEILGVQPTEVVFTSGATEADNLAILGRARFAQNQGRRLVVPRTEHKAVIDPVRHLQSQGWQVDWLDPGSAGACSAEDMATALGPDAVLACAMAVNNETGHIHDVVAIAQACLDQGVPLHVDAAQAPGKVPLQACPGVGSMAFSGHKLGAPAGIGALYVRGRPRLGLEPLVFGGGQERGMRSGTLPAMLILAFVAAAKAAVASQEQEFQRLRNLREALWGRLDAQIPELVRNSPVQGSSPHVLNITVPGVQGDSLRAMLPGLALSSGSACAAAQAASSYVLRARGHDDALANASLRLSFGHSTSQAEVEAAAEQIIAAVGRLRSWHPGVE
jgi:cysteine desulfurase